MASPAFITFFLLISSPLILRIHARDSQFFSKVSTTQQTPTQTVVLPDKEKEQQSLVNPKRETEQQPEFVPQNENGYGLYGHETGLNPPEAESPSTFSSAKHYNNDKDGEGETFYSNNGDKFDTSSFNAKKDDLLNFDDAFDKSNGRFGTQLGPKQTETYYKANRFDDEVNSRYKAYRGEANADRKGMSDTRFVENGKYYYDLENEQNGQYDSRRTTYNNRAYDSSDKVVGNRQYDGASYDNSGTDKYEFNTNQYDP